VRRHLTLSALALVLAGTGAAARQSPAPLLSAPPLEHYLEALRQQAGIPGMSAAVIQEGEVVWEHGFGHQNLESRIPATPDTPYLAGGLMQSLAAVLLLQCVEQKHLELDGAVRRYGLALPEPDATLRQMLTHSSTPGDAFQYSPERYARLSGVIEWCAPQPYRKTVAHRILDRLAMKDSVPGTDLRDSAVVPEGLFEASALERYSRILERLAVPYKLDRRNKIVRADAPAPEGLNAAGGLVTTVRDYAQFDKALDSIPLLLEETRAVAWSKGGGISETLPTGLGWFVQIYKGEPVVWHFGQMEGYASLVVKLPARRMTFIVFANSDRLNSPFDLASGDVTRSLFALVFLRLFVP
jgi:CubicO group peptidase (beta-lactamase class C family)